MFCKSAILEGVAPNILNKLGFKFGIAFIIAEKHKPIRLLMLTKNK